MQSISCTPPGSAQPGRARHPLRLHPAGLFVPHHDQDLVDKFNIKSIGSGQEDIKAMMAGK